MTTRLLLVRHGQTSFNREIRFMGQLDIPLDETGRAQVLTVAKRLTSENISTILCSDLSRARDTGLAIQSANSGKPELLLDERLREMDFGDWEGLTYAEIKQASPDALAEWEADRMGVTPHHGETLGEFAQRIEGVYSDIVQDHAGEAVVVAAHGGSVSVLIAVALGFCAETYWKFHVANAALSELRVTEAGAALFLLNDTSHLGAAQ